MIRKEIGWKIRGPEGVHRGNSSVLLDLPTALLDLLNQELVEGHRVVEAAPDNFRLEGNLDFGDYWAVYRGSEAELRPMFLALCHYFQYELMAHLYGEEEAAEVVDMVRRALGSRMPCVVTPATAERVMQLDLAFACALLALGLEEARELQAAFLMQQRLDKLEILRVVVAVNEARRELPQFHFCDILSSKARA